MYGVIYVFTNSVNGKQYVGQTTEADPVRYCNGHFLAAAKGSEKAFHRAIQKYGRNAFSFEVIWHADGKVALDVTEDSMIRLLGTMAPGGYNLRGGGSRGKFFEETRRKLKEVHNTPEAIARHKRHGIAIFNRPDVREKTAIALSSDKKRAAQRATFAVPEVKARIIAINKENRNKPEAKIRTAEISRENWRDPSFKKKISIAIREAYKDPIVKERLRSAIIKGLTDPKVRERMSASIKKSHSSPIVRAKIKVGSDKARHVRWHVNRNIINPNCPLCNLS